MKEAARQFREAKAAVEREMKTEGNKGNLRFNSQMPSWLAYVKAEKEWNKVLSDFIEQA
jgi:hypothetical protein